MILTKNNINIFFKISKTVPPIQLILLSLSPITLSPYSLYVNSNWFENTIKKAYFYILR